MSFAAALFNLDDFSAGQQMLRHEPDAAWRSDTLTRLAMLTPTQDIRHARSGNAPAINLESLSTASMSPARPAPDAMAAPAEVAPADAAPYFGKQLRYNDVFRGQKNSQTQGD